MIKLFSKEDLKNIDEIIKNQLLLPPAEFFDLNLSNTINFQISEEKILNVIEDLLLVPSAQSEQSFFLYSALDMFDDFVTSESFSLKHDISQESADPEMERILNVLELVSSSINSEPLIKAGLKNCDLEALNLIRIDVQPDGNCGLYTLAVGVIYNIEKVDLKSFDEFSKNQAKLLDDAELSVLNFILNSKEEINANPHSFATNELFLKKFASILRKFGRSYDDLKLVLDNDDRSWITPDCIESLALKLGLVTYTKSYDAFGSFLSDYRFGDPSLEPDFIVEFRNSHFTPYVKSHI